MRLTALLWATLVLAPGLGAQEPSSLAGLPIHGEAPAQLPVQPERLLSVVERPSDVVARLARQALTSPEDTATWNALAGALPALALDGDADLEGTFEAARLADSLSLATVVVSPGAQARAGSRPPQWSRLATSVPGKIGMALVATVLVIVGVMGTRARRASGSEASTTRRREASGAEAGRLWTARTLATSGASVPEIAKRTGMAQEAVDLALSLGPNGTASRSRSRRRPPRPLGAVGPLGPRDPGGASTAIRAGQRPTATESQLRRDVLAGVGQLKDQRLTYGGGMAS